MSPHSPARSTPMPPSDRLSLAASDRRTVEIVRGLQSPELEATDAAGKKKKTKKKRVLADLDSSSAGNKVNTDVTHELAGESDMNEPTMEERLSGLGLLDDDKAKNTSKQEPSSNAKLPSADSVHVLLRQALHADDHALLLDCLYTRDEKVIAKSTSLLNPADVLKLLNSLVSMTQSRGAVLICILPWLRSLLVQHASSIVSQESSLRTLNSLYQLIESRNSTFQSTLQLSACVDCLFAGITVDEADEETTLTPVFYEDKDSDEESEDAMETEEEDEDLGAVIDFPNDSEGSDIMTN